jgi:hypothetical protein
LDLSIDSTELQHPLGGGVAPRVLPMIAVLLRYREIYTEGLEVMRQIFLARAFPDILPSEHLNLITALFDHQERLGRLCLISGGEVRDLLRLLFDCLREQNPPFEREYLELVIERQRDYRANAIDPHEWQLVFPVMREQRVKGDIE